MRRDDAPKTSYFSAADTLHQVWPHPVFAEPGELTAAFMLDLEAFTRNPDEYRMYFVACVPLLRDWRSGAHLRCSLLICGPEHWEWCKERDLTQLDFHNNSVLQRTVDPATGQALWLRARQFRSHDIARPVHIAVAVAGELSARNATMLDLARPFKTTVSGSSEERWLCHTCSKTFLHEKDLFRHFEESLRFFECPITGCGQRFPNRQRFGMHLRVHSDSKPFECRVDSSCGATFKLSSTRAKHERRHSDPRAMALFDLRQLIAAQGIVGPGALVDTKEGWMPLSETTGFVQHAAKELSKATGHSEELCTHALHLAHIRARRATEDRKSIEAFRERDATRRIAEERRRLVRKLRKDFESGDNSLTQELFHRLISIVHRAVPASLSTGLSIEVQWREKHEDSDSSSIEKENGEFLGAKSGDNGDRIDREGEVAAIAFRVHAALGDDARAALSRAVAAIGAATPNLARVATRLKRTLYAETEALPDLDEISAEDVADAKAFEAKLRARDERQRKKASKPQPRSGPASASQGPSNDDSNTVKQQL